jgi:hypothetical protein
MSDTLNIKRYRLAYGGAHESDVRRWRLRRVGAQRGGVVGGGGAAGGPLSAQAGGAQRNEAMYASPART